MTTRGEPACADSPSCDHPYVSETAVGAGSGELAAERASDRSDDDAHVVRGQPGLVPHDVTAPVVDEPLTCGHHVRRAVGIVVLVVSQLALRDRDQNRAGVAVPA